MTIYVKHNNVNKLECNALGVIIKNNWARLLKPSIKNARFHGCSTATVFWPTKHSDNMGCSENIESLTKTKT